ncbi:hypothetical protein CBP21_10495 [Fischerella thermalis WC246]|nr:hypothetical protein CBP17_22285 [Fischerella thermalis WC114]PLZ16419.1 hypothetical protein CBP30_22270 [Fischerella thermalis WC157]PLZ69908.1 hypothetical protein CBP21_10495 [Fischerella thermalis WC246]PLZ71010.1 hypothetical protein CBP22_06285 [Fischerella thermalis WC249]
MPSISLDGFYLDQPHVEFLLMVRIEEIKGGRGKGKKENFDTKLFSLVPFPNPLSLTSYPYR